MGLLRTRRTLLARWPLLELYVRCALAPHEPQRIAQYLACGRKLVRLGALDEQATLRRMRQVLRATGGDEALPGFWRSACLESAKHRLDALDAADTAAIRSPALPVHS